MKVAIMGYGTIGSGVVEIIEKNNKILEKNPNNNLGEEGNYYFGYNIDIISVLFLL